jgi:hypothetical protein
MADREQANISGEEIESYGKQRERNALYKKLRVQTCEGYDDADDQKSDQKRCRCSHGTVHVSRPNRPAGRINRTKAITMKTMVDEISG